jgi:hypothetical protein
MPANRGPSFAQYRSALAAAAAREAAAADRAKKKFEQDAELRQAEASRTPEGLDTEHRQDVA